MNQTAEYLQAMPALAKAFALSHQEANDVELAQALVFNTGRHAWRLRELGVSTEQKTSVSDVVTEADRSTERFVTTVLELLRPDDAILGEEGAAKTGTSGRTWVIDPIDGTYNYTSGSDYWCSALALVSGDPTHPAEAIIGAVHRPAMGYTWVGGKEHPTQLDGKTLPRLEDAPLSQLCLGTYVHPTSLNQAEIRDPWLRGVNNCATLRMLGAGSVDLAGVAEGTLGIWTQHSVKDWDWLPGRCLIEGVGGNTEKVTINNVEWSIAGNHQAVSELRQAMETTE